jgi:hypothetical protein
VELRVIAELMAVGKELAEDGGILGYVFRSAEESRLHSLLEQLEPYSFCSIG